MDSSANWMERAFSKHKGALTHTAARAGETPMEFAREHYHSPGLVGQRARAAVNAQPKKRKMYGEK